MSTALDRARAVITDTIEPLAADVDSSGAWPKVQMEALGSAGLLGLVSATDVGGGGAALADAAEVIDAIARACGSTAMVLLMHYCAVAVVVTYGVRDVREGIAAGRLISTLAFSEAGSRSHFWAPLSTAKRGKRAGDVRLDARKSFVTSAGHADVYVWSSQPLAADGLSTIWLVPAVADGLTVTASFDGLGLRGNASSPVTADNVVVTEDAMIAADGGGFDVMMGVVLPWFQVLSAAFSIGTMEAATAKAATHVAGTGLQHLSQSLADLPTIRAYLARMRIATDSARALLNDTLAAMSLRRADTMLRVLEVKAAAGEAATTVTDLAMRVCGGAAFSRELGIERHFRDARAATVMAPTTDVLYDFIGKAVCGMDLF